MLIERERPRITPMEILPASARPGGRVYPRRGDASRPSDDDGGRMTENYDVVIIGSGAGGGTLAYDLADSGKNILLLERGDFLPRELDNWDPKSVFVDGKYISKDTWFDRDGKPFQPQVHYFV